MWSGRRNLTSWFDGLQLRPTVPEGHRVWCLASPLFLASGACLSSSVCVDWPPQPCFWSTPGTVSVSSFKHLQQSRVLASPFFCTQGPRSSREHCSRRLSQRVGMLSSGSCSSKESTLAHSRAICTFLPLVFKAGSPFGCGETCPSPCAPGQLQAMAAPVASLTPPLPRCSRNRLFPVGGLQDDKWTTEVERRIEAPCLKCVC